VFIQRKTLQEKALQYKELKILTKPGPEKKVVFQEVNKLILIFRRLGEANEKGDRRIRAL